MKNPFRDRTMRRTFASMIEAYDTKHRDLIYPNGSRCRGNSAATYFWNGYDGVTIGHWDRSSKATPAYACFRAGRAIRAREEG